MADAHDKHVLVVLGDQTLERVTSCAAHHPAASLFPLNREDQIITALTQQTFHLAIVGGRLGNRGPLVLCDAVRLRQQVPVLVLLDAAVNPDALAQHQSRNQPNIRYLDVSAHPTTHEDHVALGNAIRAAVLEMLHLAEDEPTARAWPGELQRHLEPAAPEPVPVAAPPPVPASPTGPAASSGQPLPVTEEDLRFAAEMAERLRGVDFRVPPQHATTVMGTDTAEVKVQKLREQLKEAERRQARLAHVYGSRRQSFEEAAATIAAARHDRDVAEAKANHLAEEGARLQARVAELETATEALRTNATNAGGEAGRLQGLLEAERQARKSHEQSVQQLLAQAQDAFNALRDQSTQAISQRDQLLRQREELLDGVKGELEALRHTHADLQQRAAVHEQELDAMLTQARSDLDELTGQVSTHVAERDAAREEVRALEQAVASRQQELAQLQELMENERAAARATINQLQAEADARTGALSSKADDLKEAAATFRDHFEQRDEALRDAAANLAAAQATLREREQEMSRMETTNHELAQQLTKQSQTLEKLARELGDQKAQLGRLNEHFQRPGPSGAALPDLPMSPLWERLLGTPRSLAVATGAVVFLGGATLFGLALSGGSSSPTPALATALPPAPDQPPTHEETSPEQPPSAPTQEPTLSAAQVAPTEPSDAPSDTAGPADASAPQEPATAQVPAPATEEPAPPPADAEPASTLSPDERKEVRRAMFDAIRAKKWKDAAAAGQRLRVAGQLDWESAYRLPGALENAGKRDEAIAAYREFLRDFADNAYADNAMVSLSQLLLAKGDKPAAKELLEQARSRPNSDVARQAASLLAKIK